MFHYDLILHLTKRGYFVAEDESRRSSLDFPLGQKPKIKIGENVLIKGEEKNRGQWKLGVIKVSVKGRDCVLRGVKLKTVMEFVNVHGNHFTR